MTVELRRRRFTVEEYQRMGETGILDEDERVELIEGEIVEMNPIGPLHGSVVARLVSLLVTRLGDRAIVWPQNSLVLRAFITQLQPDIALLRPRADYYRAANPEPRDVLLVIEVMDSSVDRDRRVKLPLYARAGLAEVWLAHVASDTVEICRNPVGGDYRDRHMTHGGDGVRALAFPDLTFEVAAILG
jgi:Uma2 family endonuclease